MMVGGFVPTRLQDAQASLLRVVLVERPVGA